MKTILPGLLNMLRWCPGSAAAAWEPSNSCCWRAPCTCCKAYNTFQQQLLGLRCGSCWTISQCNG